MSDIDNQQPLDQDRLDAEQEQIARLLRFAGPRLAVPAEREVRVKTVVHDEWRESIRSRQRRRAYLWTGTALAAAAVLALAVGLTLRPAPDAPLGPPQLVATLEAATGSVRHLQSEEGAGDPGARLATGDTVFSGTAVRTEPGTRAALRLAGGPSLRLGYGTLVRFASESDLILEAGRIYLDSGASGENEFSVSVRTPFGLVEDIGTQFEVDISDQGIRVRVREGLVTLDHEDGVFEAPAGVELTMDDDGDLIRGPVPIFGPEWDWILEIAPPFQLEGSRLETFLDWVARETGWEMQYADSELQRATAGTVLHGSIAGLRPDQALEAVLPTCGLVFREEGGTVIIAAELL